MERKKSPMQLSMDNLRARGFFVENVEQNLRQGKIVWKKDLFGFADILCLKENEIVVVQTTTRSNMYARIKKITDHENVAIVRKAGIKILVHGWLWTKRSEGWEVIEIDLS